MNKYLKLKNMQEQQNIEIVKKCKKIQNCKKYINLFNFNFSRYDMIRFIWNNGFEKGCKDLTDEQLKVYTLYFLSNVA